MARLWRAAAWLGAGALASLVLAAAVYLAAAALLGRMPLNADFRPSPDGVPVYLRSNGVHVDLVLPTRAAGIDWSDSFPASDMADLPAPLPWVAIGWGDRAFYLHTPTWAELDPAIALQALIGSGPGAIHAEYLGDPARYEVRRIEVSEAQYRRLVESLRASLYWRDDRPVRILAPGYFATDAFYAAMPRYSAIHTCNEWVRRRLVEAGLPAPRWTPFAQDLMRAWPAP